MEWDVDTAVAEARQRLTWHIDDLCDEASGALRLMRYEAEQRLNEQEAALFEWFFADRWQVLAPPFGTRRNAAGGNACVILRPVF